MSANTIARAELDDPTRNMALANLADLLKDQSTRALDVIAGSGALHASGGQLILRDTVPQLGFDGVTMTAGTYAINSIATGQLAEKLSIPQGLPAPPRTGPPRPLRRQRQRLNWQDTALHGRGQPEAAFAALQAAEHDTPQEIRLCPWAQQLTTDLLSRNNRSLPGLKDFATRIGAN